LLYCCFHPHPLHRRWLQWGVYSNWKNRYSRTSCLSRKIQRRVRKYEIFRTRAQHSNTSCGCSVTTRSKSLQKRHHDVKYVKEAAAVCARTKWIISTGIRVGVRLASVPDAHGPGCNSTGHLAEHLGIATISSDGCPRGSEQRPRSDEEEHSEAHVSSLLHRGWFATMNGVARP